jgi:hypothetical protein
MIELTFRNFGLKKNPFLEIAISVILAIILSASFLKLQFFHFLVLVVLLICPYLFVRPYNTFLFFLSLLILFSDVGYAVKEEAKLINIYSKGTGILPISLMTCFLLFIFSSALCSLAYNKRRNEKDRFLLLDISVFIFLITSLIYITISFLNNPLGISEEGFRNAVDQFGLIGIVEFCLVYFVIKIIITQKKQLIGLANIIFLLVFVKASYGIIRYVFFGGEPRIYSSSGISSVKLTFFDIYDSAFFVFVLAFCFINIFIFSRKRIIFYIAIFITLFNILLSFRRTAWAGSLLALIYLFQKIKRRKRILLYVVTSLLLIPVLLSLIPTRFGRLERSVSDISFDYSSSNKMGRFGELFYAIDNISKSPIFGLGATGRYNASTSFSWRASPYLVHSAIVHVGLKMGLLGLSILVLVILGIYSLLTKYRKINFQDEKLRIVTYSTYSTLIFLALDILFGTPLVIFRHAACLGFFVGLLRVSSKPLTWNNKVTLGK